MIVSIFNDVIGPVMRGASSSHCAAGLRIGRIARDLMRGEVTHILVEFDLAGSLPTTHGSQGSDMGLFGGLLGWEADDERLPDAEQWLARAGIEHAFEYRDLGDAHPNTYHLTLSNGTETRRLTAVSTGGGMIRVIRVDDADLAMDGGYDETLAWFGSRLDFDPDLLCAALPADAARKVETESGCLLHVRGQRCFSAAELAASLPGCRPVRVDGLGAVLPVRSHRGMAVPFSSAADMLQWAARAGDRPSLYHLAVDYEMARSGLDEKAVLGRMRDIVQILRRSIRHGLEGTDYDDRILGHQSGGFLDAMTSGRLVDAGVLNRIVLYVTALMEVKSSMGVIVAAPTAGACAALPATLIATGEALDLDDEEMARGMLAAGLIGVFIANRWSFAAEVGGCQAEGGSAAAMAAAALVTLQGGSLEQAVGAASMALQNMLGLICDPVAGRVEVPCLGKNVMAAGNAVSCANMALAGYDAVIPFDETIDAAAEVSRRMPREHRCTALGGLAATPASAALERRLGGCGSCGRD